jgi:copper resistance protein C
MTKPTSARILASAAVLVWFAVDAFAHAEIETCQPQIDATTKSAPDSIVCTTSEAMDPKWSSLRVFDSGGTQVDRGNPRVGNTGRKTISVSLDPSKMGEGVYTVKWNTLSADDGDEAGGEFRFTVGR